jgi:hypothetical protein
MLGAFCIWRLASFKMHSKSGNGSAAMVVVTTGTSSTGQRDVGHGRLREHACLREVGQGGAMAESKGQERSHPWLLADQGLRAHRREKTRRERMVAFQASYWALEAVLGYVQLMREGMAGRQGSRT